LAGGFFYKVVYFESSIIGLIIFIIVLASLVIGTKEKN